MASASRVNINISDLFFNHDVEVAVTRGTGDAFLGFDPERFVEIAGTFLGHLERLGVTQLPTPEELVADYRERL